MTAGTGSGQGVLLSVGGAAVYSCRSGHAALAVSQSAVNASECRRVLLGFPELLLFIYRAGPAPIERLYRAS